MRSGLPIAFEVAFQVWSSITFICAADSSAVHAVDLQQRVVAGVERRVEQPDAGQLASSAVLLEEQLAADAVGRPHQRHRPALQVRQHQLGDLGVVARPARTW